MTAAEFRALAAKYPAYFVTEVSEALEEAASQADILDRTITMLENHKSVCEEKLGTSAELYLIGIEDVLASLGKAPIPTEPVLQSAPKRFTFSQKQVRLLAQAHAVAVHGEDETIKKIVEELWSKFSPEQQKEILQHTRMSLSATGDIEDD